MSAGAAVGGTRASRARPPRARARGLAHIIACAVTRATCARAAASREQLHDDCDSVRGAAPYADPPGVCTTVCPLPLAPQPRARLSRAPTPPYGPVGEPFRLWPRESMFCSMHTCAHTPSRSCAPCCSPGPVCKHISAPRHLQTVKQLPALVKSYAPWIWCKKSARNPKTKIAPMTTPAATTLKIGVFAPSCSPCACRIGP